MAEEEEDVGTTTLRRDSKEVPEGTQVVGKYVSRRSSRPPSKRTRSDNVQRKAIVDRERETSAGIGNCGVTKSKKGVGTAEPQRG